MATGDELTLRLCNLRYYSYCPLKEGPCREGDCPRTATCQSSPNDVLQEIFDGVEKRLLDHDSDRGHVPYTQLEMLCLASVKLKRFTNQLTTGREPNWEEVEEAIDYLMMLLMDKKGAW